mgnify:CR=1 FL=1
MLPLALTPRPSDGRFLRATCSSSSSLSVCAATGSSFSSLTCALGLLVGAARFEGTCASQEPVHSVSRAPSREQPMQVGQLGDAP